MKNSLRAGEVSIWTILLITVAAIALFLILMPVGHNHTTAKKTVLLSHIKQITTSMSIYCMDYDGVYPPATGMETVRVLLIPYSKNITVFKPVKDVSISPQLNFNLAGVSETLPPYPGTSQLEPAKVAQFFSPFFGESRGIVIGFADGHVKFYKDEMRKEADAAFDGQFDRKGVNLFPPDYLADQDPLK